MPIVLGWLIARISRPVPAGFVQQNLWAKLGAEHDAFMVVDRALMPVATGGMNTTLRDAARFGMMIRDRGEFAGQQVLPAQWVDASLAVDDKLRANMAANPKYGEEPWAAYHNMWWILDEQAGEYCAVGIHGQVIYINRSADTVMAWFSSQPVASAARNPEFRAKLQAARELAVHSPVNRRCSDRQRLQLRYTGALELKQQEKVRMNVIAERLEAVREQMQAAGYDALVVPRADEYLGEYIPAHNERLRWLSGFTGSAGLVLVTASKAAIFVDGRYTVQVRQEVSRDLFEYCRLGEDPHADWLAAQLPSGAVVACDSRMHSLRWYRDSEAALACAGLELVAAAAEPGGCLLA